MSFSATRYRIRHLTTYAYGEPVQISHHLARLTPRSSATQSCDSHSLTITPEPAVIHRNRTDYFGNVATYFTLQEPHRKLLVTAESMVTVTPVLAPPAQTTPGWESVRDDLVNPSEDLLDPGEYIYASALVPVDTDYAAYAQMSFSPGRPVLEAALDLTARINADFAYDPEATSISTPVAMVLEARRGVCQDFAHLQIACLRSLGLAARYVSGYLLTHPPEGQTKMVGADASHAWLSLFVPGAGWIDLDPTNNIIPGHEHITLGWGRDFDDVSPIKGVVLGGGDHVPDVEVDVVPIEVRPGENSGNSIDPGGYGMLP